MKLSCQVGSTLVKCCTDIGIKFVPWSSLACVRSLLAVVDRAVVSVSLAISHSFGYINILSALHRRGCSGSSIMRELQR